MNREIRKQPIPTKGGAIPAESLIEPLSSDRINGGKRSKKSPAITCVFVDIGGVLLTNGWDHHARRRAAANFKLAWALMEVVCGVMFLYFGDHLLATL